MLSGSPQIETELQQAVQADFLIAAKAAARHARELLESLAVVILSWAFECQM